MPARTSRRFGLHAPSGGDPADVPGDLVRLRDELDVVVLGYGQGLLSARPAPGVEGRMYYATDTGSLYYDMGAGWVPAAWQPGDVRWSGAAQSPPLGWRTCDGSGLAAGAYPALFSAIGTTFGGNSTTFNLPDLRGRTAIGNGQGPSLSARALGARSGAETHALSASENGVHTHNVSDPGHGHNLGSVDMGGGVIGENGGTIIAGHGGGAPTLQMGSGGFWIGLHAKGNTTGIQLFNSGNGLAHNNMPPFLALAAWIKT